MVSDVPVDRGTIYVTLDAMLTSGKVRGTVAGTPIRIDAVRTRGPGHHHPVPSRNVVPAMGLADDTARDG